MIYIYSLLCFLFIYCFSSSFPLRFLFFAPHFPYFHSLYLVVCSSQCHFMPCCASSLGIRWHTLKDHLKTTNVSTKSVTDVPPHVGTVSPVMKVLCTIYERFFFCSDRWVNDGNPWYLDAFAVSLCTTLCSCVSRFFLHCHVFLLFALAPSTP